MVDSSKIDAVECVCGCKPAKTHSHGTYSIYCINPQCYFDMGNVSIEVHGSDGIETIKQWNDNIKDWKEYIKEKENRQCRTIQTQEPPLAN